MKKLLSVACLLIACQAARAGDAKPDASAKPAPVVVTKAVADKTDIAETKAKPAEHKSLFTASAKDHNPFWPIGWVKMESYAGSSAPQVPHSNDFSVSSILLNEPPIAVINGKEMAEGEIATLNVNGQPTMIQLMAVQDGRVVLRWQNQDLVVPLRRQEELSAANSEVDLGPR